VRCRFSGNAATRGGKSGAILAGNQEPDKGTAMHFLLGLPFIGLLVVPLYNRIEPSLFGFPFFYWYLFAWVPLTSLIIWVVARATRDRE
jgi:hypothetical protein